MVTTIGTATANTATRARPSHRLAVASDGTAILVYFDGGKLVFRTAASAYTSWSSATTVYNSSSSTYGAVALKSNDDGGILYCGSGTQILTFVPITKSGASWTLGTPVAINARWSDQSHILLYDAGTGWWAISGGYDGTNNQTKVWNSSDGVTWNLAWNSTGTNSDAQQSFVGGFAGTGSGKYVVAGYATNSNGTLNYSRHLLTDTLTTWSTLGTKASAHAYRSTNYAYATDGGGTLFLLCAAVGSAKIDVVSYDAPGDTWTVGTQLGANTTDDWPALVQVGNDLYAIWSEHAGTNDYSIQYNIWTQGSSSWGSKTQFQASGANRIWNGAGTDGTTLLYVWTEGTATPWNVQLGTLTVAVAAQDTPELYGRPFGRLGQRQMHQLLAQ